MNFHLNGLIFTISQCFLGNLGVDLNHPPKLCAGLGSGMTRRLTGYQHSTRASCTYTWHHTHERTKEGCSGLGLATLSSFRCQLFCQSGARFRSCLEFASGFLGNHTVVYLLSIILFQSRVELCRVFTVCRKTNIARESVNIA